RADGGRRTDQLRSCPAGRSTRGGPHLGPAGATTSGRRLPHSAGPDRCGTGTAHDRAGPRAGIGGGSGVDRRRERVPRYRDVGAPGAGLRAERGGPGGTVHPTVAYARPAGPQLPDRRCRQAAWLAATAYLRCDDESLLTRVIADRAVSSLEFRRIAPTVAVSPASVNRVLEVLRAANYAPAGEAADGQALSLDAHPPRVTARSSARISRLRPATNTTNHLTEVVNRLRAGDQI